MQFFTAGLSLVNTIPSAKEPILDLPTYTQNSKVWQWHVVKLCLNKYGNSFQDEENVNLSDQLTLLKVEKKSALSMHHINRECNIYHFIVMCDHSMVITWRTFLNERTTIMNT